ncbi:MAG: manganese efflux pump [Clostridia bacterium]
MFEIFLIGLSLSADAFAVTISNLLAYKNSKKIMLCPLYFGMFQGLMPLIGYFIAVSVSKNLSSIGNIVVFVLLSFIGVKMICEGVFSKEDTTSTKLTHKILLFEAFATSVDALAVGISFCFMEINIFSASFIIALTTLVVCTVAIKIFSKISDKLNGKCEIIGGVILILLAIKSLIL